jgi:hypothetical protein
MYRSADHPAQEHIMDAPSQSTPNPQDSDAAQRLVAQLTGMTPDSARTFMDFVSGMRWLRRD